MTETMGDTMGSDLLRDTPPWYKVPSLIKLYLLLVSPLLTSAALGLRSEYDHGLQSVAVFMDTFGNPSGATLGFYGASMSVGGLVACLIGGPFGRPSRPPSTLLHGWHPGNRYGSDGNLCKKLQHVLRREARPRFRQQSPTTLRTRPRHGAGAPEQREALTSIYNTCIFLGLIIGSWITFATYSMESQWAWKLPCILQLILPVYQVTTIWFCPESPRWLISKGRLEEAKRILVKYHGNGEENEIVRVELQEMIAGLEADKTMIRFNKEGLQTILGNKGNRHRLWLSFWTAVGSQCLGSNFVSSYLPLILDQIGMTTSKEKTLLNGLVNIMQWVVAVSAAFIIPRLGRRTIFLASTLGMTLSFVVWTALTATYLKTPKESYGIGVIVVIFIFSMFTACCWIPLVVTYPLEVVTTKQRGVFFAFTMFCVNASSFVASYLNPVALENIGWRYYIVQCVFNALVLAIIYFTYVETRGLTLEEIAMIFDGDEGFRNASAAVGADMEKKADAISMIQNS